MVDSNREVELRRAVEALYFGYRAFTSLPDQILAEYDLGRAHHRILYFVRREPGISVGALGAVLDVSKQAINRPIRELESLGFVSVAPDSHDRRVRRLTASKEGARLEARLTGAQLDLLESVFTGVDSDAEAGWRDVMTQLVGPPVVE
ncbi:MarR family transcriptional regulator [Gordonia sp. HY442]|uniref:MarR family winged helix-turn-helix transcriptional regulator n=1 Tax=Gordonia zhenghanii TaxID=2911516 RepID=UPI001F02071E|nr:MarR family transcriptional regulator [Gordonia zhenghanii]MCF8607327.1 MarR family transcriptional regulator [Gordonia zhenghanii]